MSFKPEAFKSEIKFTEDDFIDVKWVKGTGQRIYFKECHITWYVRDSKGNKSDGTQTEILTGEGVVESGVELYCYGGHVRME